jgi:hypothetical protein
MWWCCSAFLVHASRWGLSTLPRLGDMTFLLGSRTFLRTIACLSHTSRSTTRMDPHWPGCNSSAYMLLPKMSHILYVFKINVTIYLYCAGWLHERWRRARDSQQVSGGVAALVVWGCDVLWVCGRCGVQVLDPLCSMIADAPLDVVPQIN